MNHQPFEDWILDEKPLTPEEHVELEEHLKVCENCQMIAKGLTATDRIFQNAPMFSPQPGFNQRWEAFFIKRKEEEQSWAAVKVLGIVIGICILLYLVLDAGMLDMFQSPIQMIANIFINVIGFITGMVAMRDALITFTNVLPVGVPFVIMMVIITNVFFWTAIWFVAVWKTPHGKRSLG